MKFEWLLIGSIGLLVIIALVGVFLTRPVKIEVFETQVKVADYVGINLDTDKIYFGTVPPGNKGTRDLDITSSFDAVIKVTPFQEWVSVIPATFFVEKNQAQKVYFVSSVPKNTSFGNYTGMVEIAFYRPFLKAFI